MNHNHTSIFPVILGCVAVLSMVTLFAETASSKDVKQTGVYSSATTEVVPSTRESFHSTADLSDRKPGPAWRTIGGTIKHIKGDVYTVEDYEGNQVQLYISRDTKQLRGSKKIGDRVRAEITRGGFTNSIQ